MPYVEFLKKNKKNTLSVSRQVVREVLKNGLLKYHFPYKKIESTTP